MTFSTRANECAWDAKTTSAAAEGSHLEVFRWATRNNSPLDTIAYAKAARGSFPWYLVTAAWAAGWGHLATLQ